MQLRSDANYNITVVVQHGWCTF